METTRETGRYRPGGTGRHRSCFWCGSMFMTAILLMLVSTGCDKHAGSVAEVPTATAGDMRLAVESPLREVARDQVEIFQAHYPDANVVVNTVVPEDILPTLLKKESGALLIGGSLSQIEDSLLNLPAYRARKEPVARDAIICIVNRNSRVCSLSVDTLAMMLSGKSNSGRYGRPLVADRNYRLLITLRDLLHAGNAELHAMLERSDSLLVARTAREAGTVGLLFLSSYKTQNLPAGIREQVRIVPISSADDRSPGVFPAEQQVYDGSYPLATIVHYIYIPGNPLATGLGSWLSKEGQKGFERSSLAPFRQIPRTIILK
ncbi:MAG: substrate-binding domain-containing protein [Chlorobium sp.]|uniref:substrate-binding domain-containing protein n=1 Tax=Chlorobium sp. TaxID=1095 RepID=UPI002F414E78